MNKTTTVSADGFRYWHVDYQRGSFKIIYNDGRVLESEVNKRANSQVATSTFDWEKWWILTLTTKNDLIITEGYNPTSPQPLDGRVSVYVDQNHWRTIADVLYDPTRVKRRSERIAAQRLVDLATDNGIVMPLSTAHLIETSGLYGNRRYEIGVAMAKLAGGWQIRHPLDLWKYEADRSIRKSLGLTQVMPVLHAVVTEPGALFGSDTSLGITSETPEFDKFKAMLTMPSVILDALIDPESIPKDSLAKWVNRHTVITRQIRSVRLPKQQRRNLARRRYWNENIGYYTEAYRRLTTGNDFPTFSDAGLVRLFSDSPMVGLLSELFVRRFIDHMSTWRRNDLIDMVHLSSAAAYANFVCAEVHTGTQLRDAQRALGRPETVFTSLSDLVDALDSRNVRTASERSGG